jgi:protein-L-isoaspartate(D-aspartate) O-methyltransferase
MLQLLDVRPGSRVLEIGTGSGYNAALLSELAGVTGRVFSVEIEPDLIERAQAVLGLLKIPTIDVAEAGALRDLDETFDRIIVTARADDIDARWWELLAPDGRIVVPLDIGYGGERAIGLMRDGDYLHSFGSHACAFIEMRTGNDRTASEVFFRDRGTRYSVPPSAREPLAIVAVRREHATPELLASVDAVVARPHTLFGIRR